jgi:16S rRNA processing protein RimM
VTAPETEWVTVALLGKTRGNRGEITALALSSKPERYQALQDVYLFGGGEPYHVESAWFHDGTLILKFRGVDSISEAEKLTGAEVRIPASQRMALEPGEFFQTDLVGCEVVERKTGESLGHVTAWEDSGGSGMLIVEGRLMIPFARSICVEIDPAARRIAVELPQGLKDLNPS